MVSSSFTEYLGEASQKFKDKHSVRIKSLDDIFICPCYGSIKMSEKNGVCPVLS